MLPLKRTRASIHADARLLAEAAAREPGAGLRRSLFYVRDLCAEDLAAGLMTLVAFSAVSGRSPQTLVDDLQAVLAPDME